ncbi:MAG: hypothetical protein HON14_05425 [Rhodospirillaceae bacterium]|nr:hypothetical protein [Rhodospirillaceae bacterium]MBT4588259.1 hypothetical protein [Rhodospirillaceae bacterium]MBT4938553.1 hypothetical protein [Rhodospirillaceae bacterium]MBT7269197.1 hypothetical protein [Rhodospirillaceae bacterium]
MGAILESLQSGLKPKILFKNRSCKAGPDDYYAPSSRTTPTSSVARSRMRA